MKKESRMRLLVLMPSGHSLEELAQVLDHMKEAGYDFEILLWMQKIPCW